MSLSTTWTVIPDCTEPDSVPHWHYTDLSEVHRRHLLSLYAATGESVDALGSTETLARMTAVFSSLTGIPTMPSTLFAALVAMRKAGLIPARRQKATKFITLAQSEEETPA